MLTSSQIRQIARQQRQRCVEIVCSATEGHSVRIRIAPDDTAPVPAKPERIIVRSENLGNAVLGGPLVPGSVWQPGDCVDEGQVLALVELGDERRAVLSPAQATVNAVLVKAGQRVDYGMPLFELHTDLSTSTSLDRGRLPELIDLVADERIEELHVVERGVEYHVILRAGAGWPPAATPARPGAVLGSPPAPQAAGGATSSHLLPAPLAGTFYRAAGAGSEPLVDVGTFVEPGMPVCFVEAMKIMNEVRADRPGRVVRILVQEGQPIERDQPLFEIEAPS